MHSRARTPAASRDTFNAAIRKRANAGREHARYRAFRERHGGLNREAELALIAEAEAAGRVTVLPAVYRGEPLLSLRNEKG